MAFGDVFKNLFGTRSEPVEEQMVDNGYYNPENGDGINVVTIKNDVILKRTFTPTGYEDRKAIVDAFKDGRVVVLCIEELDMSAFYRIFDYVMGAVQALDGSAERVDRETVVLFPHGVDSDKVKVDEIEEEVFDDELDESEDIDDEEVSEEIIDIID